MYHTVYRYRYLLSVAESDPIGCGSFYSDPGSDSDIGNRVLFLINDDSYLPVLLQYLMKVSQQKIKKKINKFFRILPLVGAI
jgi:hypothetical protein